MILGEPKPISGEPNEEFKRPLIGHRKYGKSLAEGENERGLKRSNRSCVKTSSMSFVYR